MSYVKHALEELSGDGDIAVEDLAKLGDWNVRFERSIRAIIAGLLRAGATTMRDFSRRRINAYVLTRPDLLAPDISRSHLVEVLSHRFQLSRLEDIDAQNLHQPQ